MIKICTCCKQKKSLNCFSVSKRDGINAQCKDCRNQYYIKNKQYYKEYNKNYYQDNKEKLKKYRKNYYRINNKAEKEYNKEYRQRPEVKKKKIIHSKEQYNKHPKQTKARRDLTKAVFLGEIIKPNICSICKKKYDKKLLHGHHKDYSKSYNVTWCCVQCHTNIHSIQ